MRLRESAFFLPLDPSAALLGREPLLKVRLTHLRGGGCVLALSFHHGVTDGFAAAMFVNALAASYARLAAATAEAAVLPVATAREALGTAFAAGASLPQPPQPPSWLTPTFDRSALFPAEWRRRLAAAPVATATIGTTAAIGVNGKKRLAAVNEMAVVVSAFKCDEGGGEGAGGGAARSSGRSSMEAHSSGSGSGSSMGALGSGIATNNSSTSGIEVLMPLQVPPPPGWWAALGRVAALARSGAAEQRRWPGSSGWGGGGLACEVLHLPAECLAQLRASAAGGRADISTNDAASALVWVLMCALRGRPLPGSAAAAAVPGSDKASGGGGGCLAMAIDLRRNLLGHTLPHSYCGMASWCIHVQTQKQQQQQQGEQRQAGQEERGLLQRRQGLQSAAAAATSSSSLGGGGASAAAVPAAAAPSSFLAALRSGAGSIRGLLTALRRLPGGGEELLALVARQITAPASSQAALLARLCVAQDAMITSWQFLWQADFGPQAGAALRDYCLVHPSPPWMAAVLPARPDEGGGLHLLLSVPTTATAALRQSPVLRELAPGHVFVS
ncbi:hypothetical protein TSOC_005341 [Tetrabaena socialis]|uniref:Uncharacterized protein n=1 Tax=Tetrabaena socialis TaxID=47790 RepID=A0A2J8A6I3_9CHLO|nr:hypothetical protein TSOC_005341 [Tetrabaena socialis]|eukprot:PNH08142.1 hypothetical protein TSOC_005341 [Tetrabaena socialis]